MRVLAIFAGAFSAGIFLAQYLLPESWLLPCAVIAFVLACGRIFLHHNTGRRLLLIGVGLSLAFGWNWLFVRQVQRPMGALAGTQQNVTMTLCEYAVPTDYGAKGTVRVDGLPGKAVYYGQEDLLSLRPGQTVEDLVFFNSAARIKDDDVTTFTSKGVFLLAYNRGEPVYGDGSSDSARWWPAAVGRAMQEKIRVLYDGDIAAFLTAILTGDKSDLSVQAAVDLSESGLYHILAVSGMHCGFLLVLISMLAGAHRRRLIAATAIPLLLFYVLLTGGSPSVVRACVMFTLLLAAPLFQRESDGPTALAAALFVILVKNPFAAASISLQLSFAAMAGLLWLTPKLYKFLCGTRNPDKVFRFIASSFSATMGALVFTVPLSGYYFGTLVLISPLSNLLCLWAASIVFIFGLISVLFSFICIPVGYLVAFIPRLFAGYILTVAGWLTKIPYHAVYFTNPYLKFWLAYVYILFGSAWLIREKSGRKYAVSAVLAIAMLALTMKLGAAEFSNKLDVMMLDVGQGQSVLMASDGKVALTDCGSANSWYSAGESAADQLATMGCHELDYLILTHFDSDHVNGVEALLARMKVGVILVPGDAAESDLETRMEIGCLAHKYHTEIRTVSECSELLLGEATIQVFPPVGDGENNERGLSVLTSLGETDILITGDMDAVTERELLETWELPDLEFLVAGHHGSKYSTSEELLKELKPETVWISVGDNSYGHPADETMRRIAEHGCAIYRTDLHGNIRLSVN